VHGRDVARCREDEARGVLGDGGVAVAADGRDLDAEPCRRREVDEARGAGAEEDDVAQAGATLQRALGEVRRIVDHRVVALDQLRDGILGGRPHVDGDVDVVRSVNLLPKAIDVGRRIDEKRLVHSPGPHTGIVRF
jgi:hypothetical protein